MANRKDSKGRVLKTGEYQRANGTYEYKFKDSYGKRRSVYADNLKELREKEKEVQRDVEKGIRFESRDITLREVLKQVVENYPSPVRTRTAKNHRICLNILLKYPFVDQKMRHITVSSAKNFIAQLNGEYAPSTIRELFNLCKKACEYGVEAEMISRNPFGFSLKGRLKKAQEKQKCLSDEEFQNIIVFMKEDKVFRWYIPHFMFLRETGLRLSEFIGLRIQDVDLERQVISLNQQIVSIPGKTFYGPLKTYSSYSTLPLSPVALATITEIMGRHPEGTTLKDESGENELDGFFVLNRIGHLVGVNNWGGIFKRVKEKYNKEHPENPIENLHAHMLRHTMTSRLLRNGMSPKGVQMMARHANIKMTMDIYAHLSEDEFIGEAENVFSQL